MGLGEGWEMTRISTQSLLIRRPGMGLGEKTRDGVRGEDQGWGWGRRPGMGLGEKTRDGVRGGMGDDKNPYTESVDLLEDLVIEYISEMVSKTCVLRGV